MEIYETEEEQVAALKDWWKANGSSVISGVVAAAIIIGGWNFWQSYQQDKVKQASAMYEQLLQAQAEDKTESVDKIATKLQAEFGSTAYGAYGLLFQAKEKVKQNDLSAAKAIFEQAIAATDDVEIKHVARTRLIRVLLAQQEYEQGLQIIADVDQSSLGGFAGIYDELKGDVYVAMGQVGEARTAYQSALQAGQSSPLLQFKLDDLTAADTTQG
ncbi:MAG: tetratricopeptide repeat protein [Methyloprofundus sp.]|nr:tetratricopeptide repeat protein [Methyloprofundus sp.]MBW6452994.1 tetratricopeptide repeat protein [Methyloprofundus sp.]